MEELRLEGKVALVTGGSRGMGRAIALRLAKEGCDVVVNYNSSRQAACEVVETIKAMGRRATSVKADIGNAIQVEQMVTTAVEEFGKIDVLMNNAGIEAGEPCPFIELGEKDWNIMFDVNVKGVFLTCRAVAPHMIKRRSGKIINTSSTCGKTASTYLVAYSATKAAVIALTQGMALELAPFNITVNALCPGGVDTDMNEYEFGALQKYLGKTKDEIRRNWESTIPLGHRMAKPDEIAGVAAFLASDDSAYVTGVTINVSGGVELH